MAALRGTLQGMRGVVSRLGSVKSGMEATVNTWTRKITVHLDADGKAWLRIEPYAGNGPVNLYQLPAGDGAGELTLISKGKG